MRFPSLATLVSSAAARPPDTPSAACALPESGGEYRVISSHDISVEDLIGAGTEKRVYSGSWGERKVALMEILGRSKERDIALQQKIAEHPELGKHPNIVRIFGTSSDTRFVLNELAPLGSLTNYDGSPGVLTRRDLGLQASLSVRLAMASQVCEGTFAMVVAGLLHRDLAARNVLCFAFSANDPSQVFVKLTDFGLTIDIGADPAWPPGHAMGTRWMAPESQPEAAFEFSEQSEVYMLGVVIWEIFSNGEVPYSKYRNGEMASLKKRGVLPGQQPRSCPEAVWELIRLCWEPFPVNRPRLSEVRAMLAELQASNGKRLRPQPSATRGPWIPHPRLQALEEQSLAPEFLELVRVAGSGGSMDTFLKSGSLLEFSREMGVYAFPIFSPTFCSEIMQDLSAFIASGRTTTRANTNNRFSLRLIEMGYGDMLKTLFEHYVQPIARVLIPGMEMCRLRFNHGHTVQRVFEGAASPIPGSNRGSKHTDGSDVTINVNIGGEWTGGDLLVFSDQDAPEPKFRMPQWRGWAELHPGKVVHQAALLESGYRINLVIWADCM